MAPTHDDIRILTSTSFNIYLSSENWAHSLEADKQLRDAYVTIRGARAAEADQAAPYP